jgi:hypothetical protein
MKNSYLTLLFLVPCWAEAQSISSSLISSGGSFLTSGAGSLSVSVGQSFTGDLLGGNVQLHQGFQVNVQQPAVVTSINQGEGSLTLYPNPVARQLYIEPGDDVNNYRFELLDMRGSVVPVEQVKTSHAIELKMSDVAPALYILRVQHRKGWSRHISIIRSN